MESDDDDDGSADKAAAKVDNGNAVYGVYFCVCVCASVGALCTYTAPNDSFKSTKAFKTVLEIKHFYFISLNFTYQMASKWKITNCDFTSFRNT